ncbi:hypothetical protein [Anaerorudis cellulosivorans]|uniref:hypothetical protein n=1 Tax=Anaerorudis cellulosivorans TaxID=3397862 RepID=UPI00221F355D|nr:hypothetical protein [Seramator thermalis]MCW1735980.1 hypothetical protein [Seramator thermalis]
MKNQIMITVILCLPVFCPSCKSVQSIPAETVKIHHRDRLVRDSVFRYDSVFVRQQADTILLERYRYVYKNNLVTDSVFINDTIRIAYPVEVVKTVKAPLTGFRHFQLWCGRIALLVLLVGSLRFVSKIRR